MAKTRRIIVVGAGLGGLAAAVGLRQRGFEVEVYEQSPALGEIGAGINITPNGAKVLNAFRAWRRGAPAGQHRQRADDVRHEDGRASVRVCMERVRDALRPAAVPISPGRPSRHASARRPGISHPSRRAVCRRIDDRNLRGDHSGKRPADRSRRRDRRRRHPLAAFAPRCGTTRIRYSPGRSRGGRCSRARTCRPIFLVRPARAAGWARIIIASATSCAAAS